MKYTTIAILIIVPIFAMVYFWHQHRKSNTDERKTDVASLEGYSVATFAGGCFWCTESDFEKVDGVVDAVSGYIGGSVENPTYHQVGSGTTGHREASQVYYDPSIVSYAQLLDVFWTHTNPTDAGGQFADRGEQYTTAIFYHNDEQKEMATESKRQLQDSGKLSEDIVTKILPATDFYIAEDYHQDYHKKNPLPYKYYRNGSGRDKFIIEQWGNIAERVLHKQECITALCEEHRPSMSTGGFTKPSDAELKKVLTPLQYKVTQREGTERPFDNKYWDNHEEGIYVDIVSGEPLFSSTDKFDSGTGWPSFLKPIESGVVTERDDYKLLQKRIEIRSKIADSHLGHIIMDGPKSNNYVRYCINSASLRFIPKNNLKNSKYEHYLELFNK